MPKRVRSGESGDGPRILLIDIETFPMLFYAWEAYEARALRVVENTSVASFSAKWLGGKHITRCIADYKGYKPGDRDDRALMVDVWEMLNRADFVVAHGGKRFDRRKLNYRFMFHRLGPPAPFVLIDTLHEVRRASSWDSHKLNELCRQLEIGEKLRTGGADLWFDCLAGKKSAWAKMKKYNARDVAPLLEGVYLELRPWINSHPNFGVFTNTSVCPKCGSGKLNREGKRRTLTCVYDRFRCMSCGGWCQSVASDPSEKASLKNA